MSKARPQDPFLTLVAKTANKQIQEDVKPYIDSLVIEKVSQVAGIVENNMKKFISKILTRSTAIEQLLLEKGSITEEEISLKTMDLEDLSWGAEKSDTPVAMTNVARVVVRKKNEGQEYGLPFNAVIPSVGVGASEFGKDTEGELIGLKVGDKKEVVIGPLTIEFTITRVSIRKALSDVKQS